jgi:uncharacterized membrane protein
MKHKLTVFIAIALLLSILPVHAATIFGTVYDFDLQQVDNVRISINTTPGQQLIATSGRYSINVPPGDYLITAEQLQAGNVIASTEEVVTITKEGSYVIDLIVFPSFDEELLNDSDLVIDDMSETPSWNAAIIGLIIGLILILIVIMYRVTNILSRVKKSLKPEEKQQTTPKDLQQLIDLIKSNDNRVTQKELRQRLPQLSEAKISLMIADLEKRGVVEKIKKGRGNIIILKQ